MYSFFLLEQREAGGETGLVDENEIIIPSEHIGTVETVINADHLSDDEIIHSWEQSCYFYSNVMTAVLFALKLGKNI